MAEVALLDSWIDGREDRRDDQARYELISPVDGSVASRIVDSDAGLVDAAVASALAAFRAHRATPAATRAAWLADAADEIEAEKQAIVAALIRDIGKPVRPATFEAGRSAAFVRLVAAEIGALRGETLPLDIAAQGAGRHGFTRRVPYGVVGAITPFNAPANLLVQKVAPALAMGNAAVVKPAPQGVETALIIARAFQRAGLPDGMFNIVPGNRETARALAAHPNVSAVTFTGGTAAGDALARAAGAKKFVAELGSNAANIVCADADLDDAAARIAGSAFEASGQQCISAQRVIVDREVVDQFLEKFVAAARALVVGEASDEATAVGPMVSAAAADRVQSMIDDAVERGAALALAPTRRDAILGPAIVVDPPREARLMSEEAFGPVAVVIPADGVEDALAIANDSEFGLQGACFTRDLATAFWVADELDVGSLWINEGSRFRLDTYPFGGSRRSGFGREGVRYAMEELSQLKFVGIRLP
ncbi:MAG: aldehyde dehydrogenase family protein [Defluviicoccus sp.]|nr:aldehyde dehydrogenase family protein [Defluviicoccus sp.]